MIPFRTLLGWSLVILAPFAGCAAVRYVETSDGRSTTECNALCPGKVVVCGREIRCKP